MSEPVIEFSENKDEIVKALFVMRANLGDVRKNATNPHFKSKYADLGAVVESVDPGLEKAGLTMLQGAGGSIEGGEYCVTVETMLLHKSGEWVRSRLLLKPSKGDPQGAGSAITYGRRYGLQALCGVVPEDDDGNRASGRGTGQGNARSAHSEGAPPAPGNGNLFEAEEPQRVKTSQALMTRFNAMTAELAELLGKRPPDIIRDIVSPIVRDVQRQHGSRESGVLGDLLKGDEANEVGMLVRTKINELKDAQSA